MRRPIKQQESPIHTSTNMDTCPISIIGMGMRSEMLTEI
jgi:hypothetical protein